MRTLRQRVKKNRNNKKRASLALTVLAVPVVSLFGFAYATDTRIPGVSLLDTTIFIDGTKDVLPTAQPYDPYRMRNTLQGVYAQDGANVLFDCSAGQCTTFQSGDNVFIVYPRSAGLLTGPTDPTYDQSEAIATQRILAAIAQAQANEKADPDTNDAIYVVGYSQGAGAAAEALKQLKDPTDIKQFVLIGNPRRNDGGILTRLPDGTYAPLAGVTFGDGTANPWPDNITVIQVTKQYDGIADSPKYVLNAVAVDNAAMGFYYLHRDYYQNVQLDVTGPNGVPDGVVDQADLAALQQMPDRYVVTNSTDNVADVLVLTPVGQLPLTRPLLDAGVPPETVAAMDPALRAVIEAGYDRPAPGQPYPSQPVRFEPLPTSTTGVQAIAAQSAQLLAGAVQPNQSNTVQLSQPTAAPLAPKTSPLAAANEPVLTSSSTTSHNTKPAASNGLTDQPSAAQPTSPTAPNKAKPSLPATNTGSETGNVVRSVPANRGGPSRNGSTTETNASTTTNGTATSGSPTRSPSGASSASRPSK